jgi:toxin-antitoxin system PIN domain toxin
LTILDANILLYAYNADAPQQGAAARWLTELLDGRDSIALPWLTIWAFVRIATNVRVWANPLDAKQAFAIVSEWTSQPGVVILQPGPRHAELLEQLILEHNATGALVTDAALAAMAIENGAVLASTDQEFRRFPGLRWVNPLESQAKTDAK